MSEQSTTAATATDLLSAVKDLEPLLVAHAGTAEGDRRMAPEVMSALTDSGLLKMWVGQFQRSVHGSRHDAGACNRPRPLEIPGCQEHRCRRATAMRYTRR